MWLLLEEYGRILPARTSNIDYFLLKFQNHAVPPPEVTPGSGAQSRSSSSVIFKMWYTYWRAFPWLGCTPNKGIVPENSIVPTSHPDCTISSETFTEPLSPRLVWTPDRLSENQPFNPSSGSPAPIACPSISPLRTTHQPGPVFDRNPPLPQQPSSASVFQVQVVVP